MPTSDPGQPDGSGPVPCEVRAAANEAYSCRWAEANVASLVFDSLLDGGTRRVPRHLVFRGRGLTVEVDVAADRCVIGQLFPPSATKIVLRWPGGWPLPTPTSGAASSSLGCPGPATLRFPAPPEEGRGPLGTEWIVF